MKWSDVSFSSRTLRQFAAIWIVFFGGWAAWFGWWRGNQTPGILLLVLALSIGPLGLVKPRWIRPIYTAWMVAVFPIGWLISLLLLAMVYYGLMTPVAVVFRLMQRDVLQRRRPPEGETCWQVKPAPKDAGQYLRQY